MPTDTTPDLRVSHLGYDRQHGSAADQDAYFPLRRLCEAQAAGRIGRVAPRFHGIPYEYSQRTTLDRHAPELLRRCREDGVDAVILVAV
jgi:hypothetical protein